MRSNTLDRLVINGSTKSNLNFTKRTLLLLFHIYWTVIRLFLKVMLSKSILLTKPANLNFWAEMLMSKLQLLQLWELSGIFTLNTSALSMVDTATRHSRKPRLMQLSNSSHTLLSWMPFSKENNTMQDKLPGLISQLLNLCNACGSSIVPFSNHIPMSGTTKRESGNYPQLKLITLPTDGLKDPLTIPQLLNGIDLICPIYLWIHFLVQYTFL